MFVPLGPNKLKMIFTHQRDEEKCLSCRGHHPMDQLGSLAGACEMLRGARAGSRDPAWCPCHQQCWEGRFTPSWELYPCTLVLPGGFCSTANSFQLWIPPVTGGLGISAGHSAGGGQPVGCHQEHQFRPDKDQAQDNHLESRTLVKQLVSQNSRQTVWGGSGQA